MVAGDSISGYGIIPFGIYEGDKWLQGLFLIQPPVGEVWLITYFNTDASDMHLTDGGIYSEDKYETIYNGYEEADISALKGNANIKLFISNSNFLMIENNSDYVDHYIQWSGVQFK